MKIKDRKDLRMATCEGLVAIRSMTMLYIIPDYYKEFTCAADQCEDTCCAGWQIAIDGKALARYRHVTGDFQERLRRSINWKEETFCQSEDKRCAFLSEDNLCDMYTALGKGSLCRTCRLYPRHVEEFEGVREITLSVSCPEVARILLGRKEPVTFLNYEKDGEEEYEEFDPFLYSKLVDGREVMLKILQNRELEIELRAGLVLGIAHDMQVRLQRGEIFSCDGVLEKYQRAAARRFVSMQLRESGENREQTYAFARQMFGNLYRLELLREDWWIQLKETEQTLYKTGSDGYGTIHLEFEEWLWEYMPEWDIQCEQLLVYWIYTYFCGAVYDGRAYAKVQMSVISVFLIYEMLLSRWIKNEKTLDLEDVVEIVYRYSREVEHSDYNLERMEKMMEDQLIPWFRRTERRREYEL